MTTRIAINGFGRIGRNVLRALMDAGRDDLQVVAINDLAPLDTNAHLFEYDSVHGRYGRPVTLSDGTMDVGQGPITVTALRTPEDLPWNGVDVALECTGVFTEAEAAARHFTNGSKKVLISAPGKGAMKTVVFGVNHDILTADDRIVSNGSCTTNCLAPIAQILNDAVGLTRGMMTTVHSYTGDQPVHDTAHRDLYRARAAAISMVPTTTGAAKALGLVLPELDGRIAGTAIRVPTPNVSCVDLTFEAGRDTSVEEINQIVADAAAGPYSRILAVTDRPLVSVDFNHDPHSAVFAADQTQVLDARMVRVLVWYDNEWGFSNRMLDTAALMAGL